MGAGGGSGDGMPADIGGVSGGRAGGLGSVMVPAGVFVRVRGERERGVRSGCGGAGFDGGVGTVGVIRDFTAETQRTQRTSKNGENVYVFGLFWAPAV